MAADAPPPPTRRCSCVSELSPYVWGGGSRDGSSHDNGGDGGGDVAHWRVALHRCSAARARIECSASTHSTMSLYAPDQLLLSMRPVHQPEHLEVGRAAPPSQPLELPAAAAREPAPSPVLRPTSHRTRGPCASCRVRRGTAQSGGVFERTVRRRLHASMVAPSYPHHRWSPIFATGIQLRIIKQLARRGIVRGGQGAHDDEARC